MVKIGVVAMCALFYQHSPSRSFFQTSDEVKPTSKKVRAQETDYENYYDDHQSIKQRRDVRSASIESLRLTDLRNTKDGFRQLHACFAPILEDLGRTRAHEVNATSELGK